MSTRVEIDGLVKRYGDVYAVADINLDIAPGKVTALLGPSGCGKTTTLKAITGLIRPTYGDIRFDGKSVKRVRSEDRGAVMVFQSHLLFPYMSVGDNAGFGLKMRGVGKRESRSKVEAMLERVGLGGMADRRPHELSGGQQQRVALARALVVEPRVLLLDEPLSNLDAHLRDGMRALISDVQRELQVTTIVVTHDQEEAVVLADDIALMLDGRIEQFGPPEDFFRAPETERAARFFGWSNIFHATWNSGWLESVLGRFESKSGQAASDTSAMAFRPDAVTLGDGPNRFEATVREQIFLGESTRIRLVCADHEVVMLVSPEQARSVNVGDEVTAHVPPGAIWPLRATEPESLDV